MNAIAELARAASVHFEAKKTGFGQAQDGWSLTLRIQDVDVPPNVRDAKKGTRFMVALVEIGDDEHPLPPHPAEAAPRPASAPQPLPVGENKSKQRMSEKPYATQAALRCKDARFRAFLRETDRRFARDEAEAREYILEYCGVGSRAEIKPETNAAELWCILNRAFDEWLTEDRAFA